MLEKANPVIADVKNLIQDAKECGMKDEFWLMRNPLQALEGVINETKSNLSDIKASLGLVSGNVGSGSAIAKFSESDPPKFTGDSTDKLDFYAFKSEFLDHIESKNLSESHKVRFLVRTCLEGEARQACYQINSLSEIFDHLKETYGNVQLLFSTKITEIRSLGNCVGSNEKKRQWAINVRSKLKYLLGLCETHGKESDLFHSSLANEVHNALPRDQSRELSKLLREKVDISKEDKFNVVMNFMDLVVNELTFDFNKEVEDLGFGLKAATFKSNDAKPQDKFVRQPTKKMMLSQVEKSDQKSIQSSAATNANVSKDGQIVSAAKEPNKGPKNKAKQVQKKSSTPATPSSIHVALVCEEN